MTVILTGRDDAKLPDGRSLTELGVPLMSPGRGFPDVRAGYVNNFRLRPDSDQDAEPTLRRSLIADIGRAAASTPATAVTYIRTLQLYVQAARRGIDTTIPHTAAHIDPADPATWWTVPTTTAVFAPMGKRGATASANFVLDSGDHPGALIVGRPGSGKSTLIHTLIASMTTLHSPDELELHPIDFREGVEFKVYATHGLPHARTIAIESDREFGFAILRELAEEITRRATLLKGEHHLSLAALRTATGQKLPRVVLFFDEFQVLFVRHDAIGNEAAAPCLSSSSGKAAASASTSSWQPSPSPAWPPSATTSPVCFPCGSCCQRAKTTPARSSETAPTPRPP